MDLELGRFNDRYAERYMASDAEVVADMCEIPFLAVRSGKAFHLLDREAVVRHFAANMLAYRTAGAASADIVADPVVRQSRPRDAQVTRRIATTPNRTWEKP